MTVAGSAGRLRIPTILFGIALGPLNSTMIAVALPAMAEALSVGSATTTWLVTAYLIAMASLQPVAGKLGDRLGRRPVLLGGCVLFAVASGIPALLGTVPALIVCRVAQAGAGALMMPTGMALLRDAAPEDKLGRTLGTAGAVVTAATALGPALGGALLALAGWPAIFLVNVPLAACALVMGWVSLPRTGGRDRTASFDLAGAILLCCLLVGLTLLLDRTPGAALAVPASLVLLAGVVVFLRHEHRHPDAVLRPSFFARRGFAAAGAGMALANCALYITLLGIPMLLHRRGFEDSRTGLVLTALTLASGPLMLLGGRLAESTGPRVPSVGGLVLVVGGSAPLAVFPEGIPIAALTGSLVAIGAGVGMSIPSFQFAALRTVQNADSGVAAGVLMTSYYLGSITGTSLLTGPLAPKGNGTEQFPTIFATATLVAILAALAACTLPGKPVPNHQPREPTP